MKRKPNCEACFGRTPETCGDGSDCLTDHIRYISEFKENVEGPK